MADVLAALVPIFAVILLGFFLRRSGFPGEGFWPQAERLTYYVLFPGLLVGSLSRGGFEGQPVWPLATVLAGAVLGVALALTLLRPRMVMGGPAYSSLFQSSIRPNTYVGLSAAWALLGDAGVGLSAIALLTLIPIVNVLAVSVLSRHGAPVLTRSAGAYGPGRANEGAARHISDKTAPRTDVFESHWAGKKVPDSGGVDEGPVDSDPSVDDPGREAGQRAGTRTGEAAQASSSPNRHGAGRILRELVRNPLILGCVVGIGLNAFAIPLPRVAAQTLDVLGRAALPLGLLAVGAGLRVDAVRANMEAVALGSFLKLLVLPGLALIVSLLLGLNGSERLIAVIFTAIPVSASSFILARQMGGDHELMAGLITAQTALAAVTLPIVLSMVAG